MPRDRKIATLIALVYILEEVATDDAIDLLDLLIRELLIKSQKEGQKERLKSLKDLDRAALKLSEATAVLLNEEITDAEVTSNYLFWSNGSGNACSQSLRLSQISGRKSKDEIRGNL
jgi:hypothetical protein